jgi:cobalt/nickel transport protein
MNSNGKKAIILILLCVVIAVVPLIAIKDSEFGGSDDAASQAISQLTGEEEYTPWFSPVYEPPGGETESLLFCLQAALGAGIFGYGIGVLKERRKYAKE